jgi:hypothetical protein
MATEDPKQKPAAPPAGEPPGEQNQPPQNNEPPKPKEPGNAMQRPENDPPPATEKPPADAPGTPGTPPADPGAANELMIVKTQLEAVKSGVRPDMAEDAVYLAMRQAEQSGAPPDEASIRAALDSVLARHPEWKVTEQGAASATGFRVGAGGLHQSGGVEDQIASIFGRISK